MSCSSCALSVVRPALVRCNSQPWRKGCRWARSKFSHKAQWVPPQLGTKDRCLLRWLPHTKFDVDAAKNYDHWAEEDLAYNS